MTREEALEYAKKKGKIAKGFENDKDVVLAAVKRNGRALEFASKELKNDKEVVSTAIRNWGNAEVLLYASDDLRNDKDFIFEISKNRGIILQYASYDLRNDKEFALKMIEQDGYAFYGVSDELKNDKDIISAANRSFKGIDKVMFNMDKSKIKGFIKNHVPQVLFLASVGAVAAETACNFTGHPVAGHYLSQTFRILFTSAIVSSIYESKIKDIKDKEK